MTLVSTLMQPIREEYQGAIDQHEMRASRYGMYDLFKRQTTSKSSILTPDLIEKIKASFGRTIQVTVFDKDDVTISNVRRCTIGDSENVSKLISLTFVTYSFGFTMTPAQHSNNDISYQADFNQKLRKYLLKMAETLDNGCIAKMAADKNIYWPSVVSDVYAVTGNALQVSLANSSDFYNNLAAIMESMDYYGTYDIAANTVHKPLVNRLVNQGNANGTNTAFQFPGFNWSYSNRLANGSGIKSTLYAMPEGSVAIENRNDPDAIMGSKVGTHKIWEEVDVPLIDMKMGSYYQEDCSDRSDLTTGTTGLTRTKVQGYEWSTDVCYVSAYNSDPTTKTSPIIKAELSNS